MDQHVPRREMSVACVAAMPVNGVMAALAAGASIVLAGPLHARCAP